MQGLIACKSILSKKDITIPRLELIAAHMAANLATNIKAALKDLNIRSVIGGTDQSNCWSYIATGAKLNRNNTKVIKRS